MTEKWRIEMLGGLRAICGETVITRFRTQRTASLLAYLAYHTHRNHPREVLVEKFWPDCEIDSGRHNLRLALSSLRHQLEPPDCPPGAVIVTDRSYARLN